MVFPDNSSKKLLDLIVSMVILCVIFEPIASIGEFALELDDSVFDAAEYESEQLNDSIANQAQNIYSSYLTENLERVLDENGISYEEIVVSMDISEDYSISIGQVEVIVKNEDVGQSENIKELLQDYAGAGASVVVSSGG